MSSKKSLQQTPPANGQANQSIVQSVNNPTNQPINDLSVSETLHATAEIIELAKQQGVDFGPGDPTERIRYFIKLGILPHAVRKSSQFPPKARLANGSTVPVPQTDTSPRIAGVSASNRHSTANSKQQKTENNLPSTLYPLPTTSATMGSPAKASATVGHLPFWTVQRLVYIDRLNKRGISYPKIAEKIKRQEAQKSAVSSQQSAVSDEKTSPIENAQKGIYLFPKLGLSTKDIDQKLARHEKKIKQVIQNEITAASVIPTIKTPPSRIARLTKSFAIFLLVASATSGLFFAGTKVAQNKERAKQLKLATANNLGILGEVLAATSADHRFYIDADTEVSGTTLFAENITAPNVIYSVTGGTGIAVTGGQNPVVSLDSTEIVTTLNDTSGALTIKAGANTTVATSGSTITISNSASSGLTSEADTLSSVTGRGATTSTALTLSGGVTVGSNLTLSDTNAVFNISNGGTLAFKDGTNTLVTVVDQGSYGTLRLSDKGSTGDPATCTSGDIYFNATDTTVKACTAANSWESLDSAGGITTFTLSGDSGTDQTISDTNTLEIAGGTNGIDTVVGTTDTVTINLDTTEVGTTTFGTGSSIAWTFNSGTTDPVLTFGDNTLTIGSAATITATDVTAFNCTDCIDFDDMEDTLDLDTALTLNQTTNTWTQNFTGTTTTGFTYNANSLSSGTAVSIASTSTAGSVSGESYLLNLSRSGANTNGVHTAYGISSSVFNTGTTATNIAGYFSASSNAATNYGVFIGPTSGRSAAYGLFVGQAAVTVSGTAYGIYGNGSASSFTNYGIWLGQTGNGVNNVGIITDSVGSNSAGTTSAQLILGTIAGIGTFTTNYGITIGAISQPATTSYGINIGAITSAGTTNYGLNMAAVSGSTTNYAIVTAGGGISNTLTSSTAEKVLISATTNTGTAGVLDIDVTTTTDNNRGVDLSYTFSNTSASTRGYGIYGSLAHTNSTNANTLYGQYLTILDSVGLANTNYGSVINVSNPALNTSGAKKDYGLYVTVANQAASVAAGTEQLAYGIYSAATGTQIHASGVITSYGGYFSATGDSNGVNRTYGIYTTAASGTINYGLYVGGGNTYIGTTVYGASLSDCDTAASSKLLWSDTGVFSCGTDTGSSGIAWSALTNPTTSLSLTFDDAEINTFTVSSDTEDFWTFNAASLSSGSILVGTGHTTVGITDALVKLSTDVGAAGSVISVSPDFSGSAVTGYGIYNVGTDSTTTANVDYNFFSTLTASGNLAANTAGTYYGIYGNATKTGTDTANTSNTTTSTFGVYGVGSNTASTDDAEILRHTYGGYFNGTGNTNSTSTTYGIYATATSADTNFAFYSTATTAAANYALYTANGNVSHILGASDSVFIDAKSTLNTTTAGILDIDILNATTNATGINLRWGSDASGYLSAGGYGILSNISAGGDTNVNQYGIYNLITDASLNPSNIFGITSSIVGQINGITGTQNLYGGYFKVATAEFILGQNATHQNYGIVSSATATSVEASETVFAYGGHFTAISNTGGTGTAYGIYSTASGGDANFAIYSTATTASSNYALYTSAGNIKNVLGVTDFVTIDNTAAISTNSTTATGSLYVNSKSLTSGNTGASFNYLSTNATATSTQYGFYNNFSNASACVCTSVTNTYYGQYGIATKSGADSLTTAGTTSIFGIYSDAQNTSTDVGPFTTGTRNTYGGYFSATNQSLATGTSNQNTYGVVSAISRGNSQYAFYVSQTESVSFSSAATITTYGNYVSLTHAQTIFSNATSNSIWGLYGNLSSTTTQALPSANSYGAFIVNTASSSSGSSTGTFLGYGVYAATTGTSNGTNTQYGVYTTATEGDNVTGVYSLASSSSTTTGDPLYGGYFKTANTGAAAKTTNYGAIAYGQTTSTTGDTVFGSMNYGVSTGTTTTGTRTIYGAYNISAAAAYASGSSQTTNNYASFALIPDPGAITATSPTITSIGTYGSITKTGADSLTTAGTFNFYGAYGIASNTSTDASAAGTRNTIGGYFSATGAAAGTTTAYGIYTTAASADTNYGIYSAAGTDVFKLGAAEKVYVDGTATTNTGTAGVLDIDVTSATNQNSGINLNYTYNPAGAGAVGYGLYESLTVNTSGTSNVTYGQYQTITNNPTGNSNTVYGTYNLISDADDNSNQLYGTVVNIDMTTNTGLGTPRVYGGYFSVTGQTAGANTLSYAIYASGNGSDTNYGLYTAVGNIYLGLNATESVIIDGSATPSTSSTGVLDINVTSSTTSNSGINLAYTSTAVNSSITQYGAYNNFIDTQNLGGTSQTFNFYSTYGLITKTGTDAHTTAGTTNAYGITGIASNTSGDTGSLGTKNTYGGYFTATGAAAGTTTAYGIYTTAASADTNYGLAIGANSSATTANYGAYIGALSGATTSKGIEIGALSSATSTGINIGAFTGATTNTGINITSFATGTTSKGIVIGTNSSATAYGLDLGALSGATTNVGIKVGAISGTGTGTGVDIGAFTNTGATQYGINIGAFSGTHNGGTTAGVNIGNISSTGTTTNNYGINIGNISGGTTLNSGLNIGTMAGESGSSVYTINTGALTAASSGTSYQLNLGAVSGLAGGTFGAISTGTISSNGAASYGINLGANTATTASNSGINIGALSGTANASSNYGINIGAISKDGTTSTNYGINLGTMTGGTSGNYQISTGILTSATTTTNAQINLGGVVTTGGTTNYGINVGVLSGTGTNNYAINIAALTSAGTISTGINIAGSSGAATSSYGINIGAISGAGTNNYGLYIAGASGATTNYGIYSAAGTVKFVCTTQSTWTTSQTNPTCSDYAEVYETEDISLQPGDIIAIDNNRVGKVTKTHTAYQNNIVGIYSTSPGLLIGPDGIESAGGEVTIDNLPQGKVPVALIGKVPVKVNAENGPIEIGDLLTSSSTPGVAMKADARFGSTIGKAIEPYNSQGEGKVLMDVENNSRADLRTAFSNLQLNTQSLTLNSGAASIDSAGNINTLGDVFVGGQLSAASGQFTVDSLGNVQARDIQGSTLQITGDASIGGNLTVGSELLVSGNAKIAGTLETTSIQAPATNDLTIRLGDSAGATALSITNTMNDLLLTISSAGHLTLNAVGATLTLTGAGSSIQLPQGYICVNDNGTCSIANPVNGTVYADAFQTNSTADLAEAFPTQDETIEAADIVAVDPENPEHVLKSNSAYQTTILGIISTDPGITLNAGLTNRVQPCNGNRVGPCEASSGKKLALAGRVPTKVSAKNGAIKAGDFITSSDIAGVGMKATHAGRTIGIALESFECSQAGSNPEQSTGLDPESCQSTIVVFVEPGWFLGGLADNGSIENPATQQLFEPEPQSRRPSDLVTQLADSKLNPDGTLTDSQRTANSQQLTPEQIQQLVRDEVKTQLASLQTTDYKLPTASYRYDSPQPSDQPQSTSSAQTAFNSQTSPEATSGAQLAAETGKSLNDLENLLKQTTLTLDSLTLTGPARLANTQLAGTFSQDGTLIIDYGKQINVLGSTLYLQNDSLAGNCELSTANCQLIDIGDGKVTIDKEGNLVIAGTLNAKNVQTKELTIDTNDENAKSVGTSTLSRGQSQITIFTTLLKPGAKVLITPTTPTQGRTLYIAQKSDYEGFTIALENGPATNTIRFDWLIVNTSQITQAN